MRRCFYHKDLGQNVVFHNFEIKIALIQYSGRSKQAWAFSETAKKISNGHTAINYEGQMEDNTEKIRI